MTAELTLSQLNGRFKLSPKPFALPGKCAVCGSVDKPVVDFGFEVDYYGVVYICEEDMRAAAQILGMVDGKLLDTAELVQRAHQDELDKARSIVDEFNIAANALCDSFIDRFRNISLSSSIQDDEVPLDEPAGESRDTIEGTGQTEPIAEQSIKPARNKRSTVVSSSSNNGSGTGIFADLP